MDVLAASLTAGLDAPPGEDLAEGDLEAEAPMRHFFAAEQLCLRACLCAGCASDGFATRGPSSRTFIGSTFGGRDVL